MIIELWNRRFNALMDLVTVIDIRLYDHFTLTHPLGVPLADSSLQIAAVGWGPTIHIPVCSKVSSHVAVSLWHDGLPGLSSCRETSVWYCCFPAIHSLGNDAVGRVLQTPGGCETSLARWQSPGCVGAPGKGQRRNSSTGGLSDRCRAPGRQAGERRRGAPRRRGAAQRPRRATEPLPSQPALLKKESKKYTFLPKKACDNHYSNQ